MDNLIICDDVRRYCLGKAKFDVSRFEPFIEPAELDYVMPFLGKELYAEIRTQYLADTLTEDNAVLVNNYLKTPCAWIVLAKALPFLNMDITNSGIQRSHSEFASSGSKDERADLVTSALENAEVYFNKAKTFLEDQTLLNKYPLYLSCNTPQSSTKIIGGIIFDTDED